MQAIKKQLDDYLEFDSSKLFVDKLVRIFGGAIRDSIAGQPINDVDILVGSIVCKKIESILVSQGYIRSDFLCGRDLQSMYTSTQAINEPRTWIRGSKIVQLIRPAVKSPSPYAYEEQFYKLISNVDLSCCGVSYDGQNLYENVEDAIVHCLTKNYKTNLGVMYNPDRIVHRKKKLLDRGWREVYSLSQHRDSRIEAILSEKNIEYIKELQMIPT